MDTLQALFSSLWDDYAKLNPQAKKIHSLLESRGEKVVNDHIALRTYDDPRCNVDVLQRVFTAHGYEPRGSYVFKDKKLRAQHFEHPDTARPKIFISQLTLADFSPELQSTVKTLLDQAPKGTFDKPNLPMIGRPWKVSYAQYEALRKESEYAAWVAAFGFRANHFTVLVNALKSFKSLQELNDFLKQNGFKLNSAGGEIKGSTAVHLEQSSTLADQAKVDFSEGPQTIPACYYEFARRYPMPDGNLFQGFVEGSADKIFESTNKR